MEKLERISEIDAHTFEIEGTDEAVNAYLAKKDPVYLRAATVEIRRNPVTNTVVARVTSHPRPQVPVPAWRRDENGRLSR